MTPPTRLVNCPAKIGAITIILGEFQMLSTVTAPAGS